MELEGLLDGNKVLIYFIGILYILINESFEKNQKIVMLYILTYTLKVFNIMDSKAMLIMLMIVSFLYIGFLSKDNFKNIILYNIWDKIKDYLYKCVFEYSAIYFVSSLLLVSTTIQSRILMLKLLNIDIKLLNIEINLLSIILLFITLDNITSRKYETNTFQYIKDRMDKITSWTKLKRSEIDEEKLNMLIDVEDKSFFQRENSYNFMSFEFVKYRLYKSKLVNIFSSGITRIPLKKNIIKRIVVKAKTYIRGYSTIEMQIIRTLGIKFGYSKHVICRKIYELLYSKMFFKNLRTNMNRSYLNTEGCCEFKEYLLCIYIGIAPIKLNGKTYKNMLQPWGKRTLKQISKEQFFISILGLSYRKISNEIIYNYNNIIRKYDLNPEEIGRLVKEINRE